MSTKRISKSYYILSVPGEYNIPQVQVCRIGDGVANRVDVSGEIYPYKAVPGETIRDTLRRLNPSGSSPNASFTKQILGQENFIRGCGARRSPLSTLDHRRNGTRARSKKPVSPIL